MKQRAPVANDIEASDYILAKFTPAVKQAPVYYVGRVISKDRTWTVTYFCKTDTPCDQDCTTVVAFKPPPKADVLSTKEEDIVMKLDLKEACKTHSV